MTTYLFSLAPPTDEQIRNMINPGVPFVVGTIASPPTFELELDSANPDDHEQLLVGMRPLGWAGEVLP